MIELGFFLLCVATAGIAWAIGAHLGVEWYYRVLAAAVGLVLPVVLFQVILRVNATMLNRRPPRPVCENGGCKWDDYHVTKFVGEDIEFVCKCGKRYVMSGRRFFKLRDDGQREPYKVLGGRHQWEDDVQG
jgi:hypothetical protein